MRKKTCLCRPDTKSSQTLEVNINAFSRHTYFCLFKDRQKSLLSRKDRYNFNSGFVFLFANVFAFVIQNTTQDSAYSSVL